MMKRLMTVSTHLATTQEEALRVENASLGLLELTNAVSAYSYSKVYSGFMCSFGNY